jgi:hypothetical protein
LTPALRTQSEAFAARTRGAPAGESAPGPRVQRCAAPRGAAQGAMRTCEPIGGGGEGAMGLPHCVSCVHVQFVGQTRAPRSVRSSLSAATAAAKAGEAESIEAF